MNCCHSMQPSCAQDLVWQAWQSLASLITNIRPVSSIHEQGQQQARRPQDIRVKGNLQNFGPTFILQMRNVTSLICQGPCSFALSLPFQTEPGLDVQSAVLLSCHPPLLRNCLAEGLCHMHCWSPALAQHINTSVHRNTDTSTWATVSRHGVHLNQPAAVLNTASSLYYTEFIQWLRAQTLEPECLGWTWLFGTLDNLPNISVSQFCHLQNEETGFT